MQLIYDMSVFVFSLVATIIKTCLVKIQTKHAGERERERERGEIEQKFPAKSKLGCCDVNLKHSATGHHNAFKLHASIKQ